MKNPLWFALLGLIMILFFAGRQPAQTITPMQSFANDPYEKEWKSIDSLENKGLPRSALEQVEKLYSRAKADNNPAQQVKTLLYRAKYTQQLEEDGQVKAIELLQGELPEAAFPVKPLLQSMLARIYVSYLETNRWKIQQRTEFVSDETPEDIRVWTMGQLLDKASTLYRASLQDAQSRQVAITQFADVMHFHKDSLVELRPTLFDYLAHQALEYYTNDRNYVTRPAYYFQIDDEQYFSSAKTYARMELESQDEDSPKLFALRIFQELLQLHLADNQRIAALVDADLKRLKFVYDESVLGDKQAWYRNALEDLQQRYKEHEAYAEITYYLADMHRQEAQKYQPNKANPIGKESYKRAEELCAQAIEKFPDSYGAKLCRSLLANIRSKELSFQVEKVNLPKEPFRMIVQYRNLNKLWCRVVPVTDEDIQKLDQMRYEKRKEFVRKLRPLKSWQVDMPSAADHHKHLVELPVEALPLGQYMLLISDNADFDTDKKAIAFAFTQVSALAYWWRDLDDEETELIVANRKSGNPEEAVTATFWRSEYNNRRQVMRKVSEVRSDKNGLVMAKLPSRKSYRVELKKGEDRLFLDEQIYNYTRSNYRQTRAQTHLFTDRAIYRPGQTIYFKGILINYDGVGMPSIQKNRKTTVTLFDVNNQKVESLELVSNDYGSIQASFQLPQGLLNGRMSLHVEFGQSRQYFRVEEYKRPKFSAKIEPLKGAYRLGDKLVVKGSAEAYAGNVIDGATVSYRVMRQPRFPYWRSYFYWPYGNQPVQMTAGKTTTDAKGNFEIEFEAKPDRSIPADMNPVFYYSVTADVTDITGETRTGSSSVSVGYTSLRLSSSVPAQIAAQKEWSLPIYTNNLNGQPMDTEGSLRIERLESPDAFLRARYWSAPDAFVLSEKEHKKMFPNDPYRMENEIERWPVASKQVEKAFNTAEAKSLKLNTEGWKAGGYKMTLQAVDSFGKKVEQVYFFRLYLTEKKGIPVGMHIAVDGMKGSYEPGEKMSLRLASCFDNQAVWYERDHAGKREEKKWLRLKNWETITAEVEEKHRGSFYQRLYFMNNNRIYQYNNTINVPWTNKQLEITYGTFRDKLYPGQDEEWVIKVSGPKKDQVAAEVVAGMYDASLDVFQSNYWNMNIFPSGRSMAGLQAPGFNNVGAQIYADQWNKGYSFNRRSYPSFNWWGYAVRDYHTRYYADEVMVMSAAPPSSEGNFEAAPKMRREAAIKEEAGSRVANVAETYDAVTDGDQDVANAEPGQAPPVRTNLKETVFFFPNLQTDEEGNVIIRFTMNEALTKWKFMALAHTQDLKIGSSAKEVVTQKDLMVQPNPPRFLREFDEIEYVAKVSNLSDKKLEGKARLTLFDATDMRPVSAIYKVGDEMADFSIEPGQSQAVRWRLQVASVADVPALVHRVTAEAGSFSDGEEAAIPVLTNRMLVTETMPLPVRGNQKKTFTFNRMNEVQASPSMAHHKYTLEFTSNPAWYAVQALPYMMQYPYECVEQVFNSYYANSLATTVANAHPRVRQVFDQWRNIPEAASPNSTFASALERNQELKAVLLEETPWVLNAQSESQQKRNIALLFDLNRMADEQQSALFKLQQMQRSDGGFSWFPGARRSNVYITQYVLEGIGHLDHLNAFEKGNSGAAQIAERALRYADQELVERYEDLKERVERGYTTWEADHLGNISIHYLYMRSFYLEDELSNKEQKIVDYYLGQAEKYWTKKSIYQQGLLVLALHRFDKKAVTADIIKSLKERSLYHEELGRYWKNDWGYFWYQLPIETHSLLIEAFADVAQDAEMVEELKIWLLKNKQTNHWETTKATASAVYALLSNGDNWLLEEELVDIKLGGKRLDLAAQGPEAGTGYVKMQWDGDEIEDDMAKIQVINPNKSIAWGAAYWQYFENLDKITHFEDTPLKIKKELFKLEDSDAGQKLVPITEGANLAPGTKLKVRIELRVDRDMEYVHMRDMRASGFEPANVFSGYRWQGGLGYYETTKDAATNFFFDFLPKGTYVFEYPLWVQHRGDFSNGITTIQCMYAPEFTSHSEGIRVEVK